jgi:two-component system OmpR family sensor kinase
MRWPLFAKIFFSVCLSFIAATQVVWVIDSMLQANPSRTAERTARLALSSLSTALRLGGEPELRRELATWPAVERQHLTFQRVENGLPPAQDPLHGVFSIVAADTAGHRYGITYVVRRFDGFVSPPLAFDMGPHVFFGSFVVILAFSALLTLFLTSPINRIRKVFRRLADGDLKVRLGKDFLGRRDEISDMAIDFNKMAGRLEDLVRSRDRLLADISHELRSPLARLQLAIALARQSPDTTVQSLERIGLEADRLEAMVGELLALSKFESGSTTCDEYFYVSEIVSLIVEDAWFEALGMGIDIAFAANAARAGSEALVTGSGKLISRAIENVVRNAVRFSRRGDAITIALQSDATGTNLSIRDQGPGVNAEQLATLFDPFVQAGTANGQGYGLGLAIAKRAILAHGGTIKAVNGDVSGLIVSIWLPASPDNPDTSEDHRSVWDQAVTAPA